MIKLNIAQPNYEPIYPILLGAKSVTSLSLKTQIQTSKELTATMNTNGGSCWQELKDNPESRLILEIDDYKLGFWKNTNQINRYLVLGDLGGGSDSNTSYGLTDPNADYIDIINYPLDISNPVLLGSEIIYYIKNNKLKDLTKDLYRIDLKQSQTSSESTNNNNDNIEYAKKRLYQQAIRFLEEQNDKMSINQQIDRESGVNQLFFYSSVFELTRTKRKIPFNYVFNDYSIKNILNQIDSESLFFNFISEDVNISTNTGISDNYTLLDDTVKKIKDWSWREDGLIDVGANGNPKWKTKITVGNFNDQDIFCRANSLTKDNWFEKTKMRIHSVRSLYPTFDVNLDFQEYIPEGVKIQSNYKQYQKTLDGKYFKIFDFKNTQFFQGFINGIELAQINNLK